MGDKRWGRGRWDMQVVHSPVQLTGHRSRGHKDCKQCSVQTTLWANSIPGNCIQFVTMICFGGAANITLVSLSCWQLVTSTSTCDLEQKTNTWLLHKSSKRCHKMSREHSNAQTHKHVFSLAILQSLHRKQNTRRICNLRIWSKCWPPATTQY